MLLMGKQTQQLKLKKVMLKLSSSLFRIEFDLFYTRFKPKLIQKVENVVVLATMFISRD